jgi:hypothetical protein
MDRAGHNWECTQADGQEESGACISLPVSLARKLTTML